MYNQLLSGGAEMAHFTRAKGESAEGALVGRGIMRKHKDLFSKV